MSQLVMLPDSQPSKQSQKKNGIVKAYSANTSQGLVRQFNEDRVSIIMNLVKPGMNQQLDNQPKCSFFGIYDGHGGYKCAEFLKENLHLNITQNEFFPHNPNEALKKGFQISEQEYIKQNYNENSSTVERSGSCAIVILIVDNTCFVANVGDSRAILSKNKGKQFAQISRDHKPSDQREKARVIKAGGNIYQSKIPVLHPNTSSNGQSYVLGPSRILPGRLSVTRSFGDLEAKLPKYGGNPQVLIAEPEISSFPITEEDDFIVIGSDGIYDNCPNSEIIGSIWELNNNKNDYNIQNVHDYVGRSADLVLNLCAYKKSLDNITTVIIGFSQLKQAIKEK